MTPLLACIAILVLTGMAAWLTSSSYRAATAFGAGGALVACFAGLKTALACLLGGNVLQLRAGWLVPYGELHLEVDFLAAFFLLIVLGIAIPAIVFGAEYLAAHHDRRAAASSWLFFNVLLASMVLVITARNAVLFLVAWELMSLSSFMLVTFDDRNENVRRAGWTYFIAAHLGMAFLMTFFLVLGRHASSLDFNDFAGVAIPGPAAAAAFALALAGFGLKAGFMPAHVWLPEAHPVAPSHVSAMMSGVMIKMGLYGLLRTITWLGVPPSSWGWILIAVGFASGTLGILLASAQHDLKRLLAYSSIENMGIVAMAMGVGMTGLAAQAPGVATLGFAACLVHILHHAISKSLLFLCAGSVLHGAGTGNLNVLGGLSKRMPWTGAAFFVGAASLAGLPPFTGFLSEFLLFLAALHGLTILDGANAVFMIAVLFGLAVIAGLTCLTFAKSFGTGFLGGPRTKEADHAHEMGWPARAALALLVTASAVVALDAPAVVGTVLTLVKSLLAGQVAGTSPLYAIEFIAYILLASIALLVIAGLLAALRLVLLRGRARGETGTWDCGYAAPAASMQYTASSFAQPVTDFFAQLIRPRRQVALPEGILPQAASLRTESADPVQHGFFRPAFQWLARNISRFRWIQHGRVQWYVLYIAITLIALLVWSLRP